MGNSFVLRKQISEIKKIKTIMGDNCFDVKSVTESLDLSESQIEES